jgi:hypothetical protein
VRLSRHISLSPSSHDFFWFWIELPQKANEQAVRGAGDSGYAFSFYLEWSNVCAIMLINIFYL